MPNRRAHVLTSRVVAAVAMWPTNPGLPEYAELAELLGGQIIAPYAGLAPDLLEPAMHSHHRQFFHSATWGAALSSLNWQAGVDACRAKAAEEREYALACPADSAVANGAYIRSVLWHVLAGAVRAALPCYLAHLAMDATTPRSIPLLGR